MEEFLSKVNKLTLSGKKYYLTLPFRYPAFIDDHNTTDIIDIILYIALLLLDKLSRGIFYKFRLDPNYSFKLIETVDKMSIKLLDKTIRTRYHPVLNYLVAVYDPRVYKHDDYYYNTIVNKDSGSCKQVLMYNIKELMNELEILEECKHINNIYQLVDVLCMYSSTYEYSIEDEINKTREYFINNSTVEQKLATNFDNITTFDDLIEHYNIYTSEQLFDLLIRWQYDKDEDINSKVFNSLIEDIKEGKLKYEDFLYIRTSRNRLRKFYK